MKITRKTTRGNAPKALSEVDFTAHGAHKSVVYLLERFIKGRIELAEVLFRALQAGQKGLGVSSAGLVRSSPHQYTPKGKRCFHCTVSDEINFGECLRCVASGNLPGDFRTQL